MCRLRGFVHIVILNFVTKWTPSSDGMFRGLLWNMGCSVRPQMMELTNALWVGKAMKHPKYISDTPIWNHHLLQETGIQCEHLITKGPCGLLERQHHVGGTVSIIPIVDRSDIQKSERLGLLTWNPCCSAHACIASTSALRLLHAQARCARNGWGWELKHFHGMRPHVHLLVESIFSGEWSLLHTLCPLPWVHPALFPGLFVSDCSKWLLQGPQATIQSIHHCLRGDRYLYLGLLHSPFRCLLLKVLPAGGFSMRHCLSELFLRGLCYDSSPFYTHRKVSSWPYHEPSLGVVHSSQLRRPEIWAKKEVQCTEVAGMGVQTILHCRMDCCCAPSTL